MTNRALLTGHSTDFVQDVVNELFPNGIVATSIIVGRIFLATDEQFGVEELSVWAGSDLIDRRWVKVDEDGSRNVLVVVRFGKEGLEGARVANIRIRVRAAVSLQAMLQEVPDREVVSLAAQPWCET